MQDDELEKNEWVRIHRTLNGEYNEMKEMIFFFKEQRIMRIFLFRHHTLLEKTRGHTAKKNKPDIRSCLRAYSKNFARGSEW